MYNIIEPRLDQVPAELTSREQWVVWKAVPKKKEPGKFTKVPYNPVTKRQASSTRPGDWGTFDDAVNAYVLDGEFDGIGFVFSPSDDVIGIDLDHCFKEDGDLTDEALFAVNTMNSYTERSPSGKGLHIICRGRLPGSGHCDNRNGREIYQEGRFFTITADIVADKTDVHERKAEVRAIYEKWFGTDSVKEYNAGDLKFDKEAKITALDAIGVSDYTKNLIVNGENMDDFVNVAGDPDRSLAIFYVCRELVTAGVNKESVLTILTDKAYYLAQASLERRKSRKSAMEWVWKYSLAKVVAQWDEEKALFDDYMSDDDVDTDELDSLKEPARDGDDESSEETPSKDVPYVKGNFEKNALLFLKSGVPLVRYQEQFFKYSGKHWKMYSDELMERDVQLAVRGKAFSMAQINNMIKTVKRFSTKEEFQPSLTTIAFQNGVLDLEGWDLGLIDNSLLKHSASHKTMSYLDFDYDPDQHCPIWLAFLNEVFESDAERVKLLQQFMGYLLVYDYRWQKMLVMAGESRSGKGTIATVIRNILGADAYVGTSLSNLSTQFGLHSLIAAKVGVIGDAKQAARMNINQAHETLLNITGNDFVTIQRKNKGDLNVRIPARLIMMANSVPRFADESDALNNRYLVLPFNVSFVGREDVNLSDKLRSESAGIFNWALEGLLSLASESKFIETAAGKAKSDEMRVFNNPIGSFSKMFLVKAKGEKVRCDDMFDLYERFCSAIDIKPTSKIGFTRTFLKMTPWLAQVKETTGDRVKVYEDVKVDYDKLGDYVSSGF
jgi:P4 family phage/plasmid primase-like protien